MWNVNYKSGSIWTTKSLNQYEYENYKGMSFGTKNILILSTYIDVSGIEKFTYLELERRYQESEFNTYLEITIDTSLYYINFNNIYTGDKRALDTFVCNIDKYYEKEVFDMLGLHFNFFRKKNKKEETKIVIEKEQEKEVVKKPKQKTQTIHKYGIDITFIPSKHISLLPNGKFSFSDNFNKDILSSKEPGELSIKYNIFPEKAIREIRNRKKYSNKNK